MTCSLTEEHLLVFRNLKIMLWVKYFLTKNYGKKLVKCYNSTFQVLYLEEWQVIHYTRHETL